jgi:Lrp/AsnC family transcriptional regulator for asnA, asnC and gidA
MKIDGIDKTIIKTLVKDARTPIFSIAREVGVFGEASYQWLRKLEKPKLIAG